MSLGCPMWYITGTNLRLPVAARLSHLFEGLVSQVSLASKEEELVYQACMQGTKLDTFVWWVHAEEQI